MKSLCRPYFLALLFAFLLNYGGTAGSEDMAFFDIPFTQGPPLFWRQCAADESAGALRLDKPGKYYLEVVISGSGRGEVAIEPITATCRRPDADSDALCTYGFDPGTEVILRAKAAGLTDLFDGWIGDCEPVRPGEKNACRVIMNEERKRVTAVFSRPAAAVFPLPWS